MSTPGQYTDQMNRSVALPVSPNRIVSLVPSQTEFLLDIGAPVVGRTKFCVHPAGVVKDIPEVGGTKNFRFQDIDHLKPDLIIGNKEENYPDGIRRLENRHPVWMSDILTIGDAFDMMTSLGEITQNQEASERWIDKCKTSLDAVKSIFSGRVLYLIWRKPYMAAGRQTFIDEMLHWIGFENVVKEERYPEVTTQKIRELNPDFIFLSSEPYPFKTEHFKEFAFLKSHQIHLVDGEMFSWYGSRLAKAADYFQQLSFHES